MNDHDEPESDPYAIKPGLWRPFARNERAAWLECAYARWFSFAKHGWPQKPAGSVIVLDGRVVDGIEGFFCAVGEAVNGPGGYFGQSIDGIADCAMGRFGVSRPWTLVWEHSEAARCALGHEETLRLCRQWIETAVDDEARESIRADIAELEAGRGVTVFGMIVRLLEERGIRVDLR